MYLLFLCPLIDLMVLIARLLALWYKLNVGLKIDIWYFILKCDIEKKKLVTFNLKVPQNQPWNHIKNFSANLPHW